MSTRPSGKPPRKSADLPIPRPGHDAPQAERRHPGRTHESRVRPGTRTWLLFHSSKPTGKGGLNDELYASQPHNEQMLFPITLIRGGTSRGCTSPRRAAARPAWPRPRLSREQCPASCWAAARSSREWAEILLRPPKRNVQPPRRAEARRRSRQVRLQSAELPPGGPDHLRRYRLRQRAAPFRSGFMGRGR
jgi:hypothetical protein